jgi:hypothetical protein
MDTSLSVFNLLNSVLDLDMPRLHGSSLNANTRFPAATRLNPRS